MKKSIGNFLYPWLKEIHQKLLNMYQNNRLHHAFLFSSKKESGVPLLCYEVSKWILCENKRDNQVCNTCNSCYLMEINGHPDFQEISVEKGKNNIGVEKIREIFTKLYSRPARSICKIFWFPKIETLTDQASNSLLKMIEEPAENSYFFLQTYTPNELLLTLKSRCLNWKINNPDEKFGISWIKKVKDCSISEAKIAIRLNDGSPIEAIHLIHSKKWEYRLSFFKRMLYSVTSNNILLLLKTFCIDRNGETLYWLLTLLLDVIKWKYQIKRSLINEDQIHLINVIANRYSVKKLLEQLRDWFTLLNQWKELDMISKESLVSFHLLQWKKNFSHLV